MEATQASTGGCLVIQNAVHAHKGVLPALERKGILTHATMWMQIDNIILNKVGQSQNDKCYVILLVTQE